jgi:hypothetical protein
MALAVQVFSQMPQPIQLTADTSCVFAFIFVGTFNSNGIGTVV